MICNTEEEGVADSEVDAEELELAAGNASAEDVVDDDAEADAEPMPQV